LRGAVTRRNLVASLTAAALSFAAHPAIAQPPPTLAGIQASDAPNEAGRVILVSWRPAAPESLVAITVHYLERSNSPLGPWAVVDSGGPLASEMDDSSIERDREYFYRVTAWGPGGTSVSSVAGPAAAHSEWLNTTRASVLIFMIAFFAFVLYFMASAQAGKELFVRRIPGIDAIEQAIGRATEMGRPVLYIPGIQDIDDIQTLAGLVILENVARITARYETPIIVPVTYPIPFAIAQEMVKSGYVHAGRPEQYDPNSVRFVSPEQFAYVAAVTGIMTRDHPGAHIFMGSFYAESLLLAETGFATGAIQVAGTANVHQLPFFVVACDYTLIGEELYAASAYLSREAKLLGSLKGADLMKAAVIVLVVVGCALETMGMHWLTQFLRTQ
jgi:hypothetical protein